MTDAEREMAFALWLQGDEARTLADPQTLGGPGDALVDRLRRAFFAGASAPPPRPARPARAILALLRERPGLTSGEIAALLGDRLLTKAADRARLVRVTLSGLVRGGRVTRSGDRPREYRYRLPAPDPGPPGPQGSTGE